MRVIGTPSRSTLSISTTRIDAEAGAEHAAAAAEDRGAADDHRGDDDQFQALAVLGDDALVLGDLHQAGERGAEGRQQVGAHAHPARRDAGIGRRLLVAAGREGLVARRVFASSDRADDGDERRRSRSGC